ncbi:hypothetical protein LJK88_37295 [Paenibacillus sp. P26]|nr:hypothetical protein LJK88_37295 [Paenibacillus sp. P26]
MSRKIYSMGMLLTMSVVILAGCGGDKTPSKTEADNHSGQSAKAVKLRFLTFGLEDQYNWKETIAGFKTDNPNIDVEVVLCLVKKGIRTKRARNLTLPPLPEKQWM